MKTLSTIKKFFTRTEGWLTVLILAVVLMIGCYEFRSVNQPEEAYNNSSFDVPIVMQQDNDEGNEFATDDPIENIGLFGVLLPEGWTIEDSIHYQVVAADSMEDSGGVMQYAAENYSNDGYLIYNQSHTDMLTDSSGTLPPGYYWWGAKSDGNVDLRFFDSLYFTVTVLTDDKTGEFSLQYAVGDEDYEGRMPYDPEAITDPIPITIVENPASAGPKILAKEHIDIYPNPTRGILNIALDELNNRKVELMIYDLRGRTLLSRTLDRPDTRLDLSHYDPGTYMIRLTAGEEVSTRKFILY